MSIQSVAPFALSPNFPLPSPFEERPAARQLGTRLTATTASSGLAGQLTVMTTEGGKGTR
ncbi:MAG: hypothetical protein QXI19_09645 [Candidatus Caldarchaeum sp.]|nr:hypothetical protein [Nitrospira sp.]